MRSGCGMAVVGSRLTRGSSVTDLNASDRSFVESFSKLSGTCVKS